MGRAETQCKAWGLLQRALGKGKNSSLSFNLCVAAVFIERWFSAFSLSLPSIQKTLEWLFSKPLGMLQMKVPKCSIFLLRRPCSKCLLEFPVLYDRSNKEECRMQYNSVVLV